MGFAQRSYLRLVQRLTHSLQPSYKSSDRVSVRSRDAGHLRDQECTVVGDYWRGVYVVFPAHNETLSKECQRL